MNTRILQSLSQPAIADPAIARTHRLDGFARRLVLGPETANIRSLELTNPAGGGFALTRERDAWFLTRPLDRWPANPHAVNAILHALQLLEHETSFAVADLARNVALEVGADGVVVDGVDATAAIRSTEVTSAVSIVAANSGVRAELRARQRAWAQARGGGVIEGRDIGSNIFPETDYKFFLDASPEVRKLRRERDGGMEPMLLAMATGYDYRRYQKVKQVEKRPAK